MTPLPLLLLLTIIHCTHAYRILALFPYPLKSHHNIFEPFLIELANRGHEMTVVTPFARNLTIPNYTQIDTSYCLHIPEFRFELEFTTSHKNNAFQLLDELTVITELYEDILKCWPMRKLQRTKVKYDLLITELFVSDVLLAYAYKLHVPFILFSTLPVLPWASDRVGNIDNPSYVSFPFSDFPLTDDSPFFKRLYNVALYVTAKVYQKVFWDPVSNKLVRKYFEDRIPPVQEIAKNTSLVLTFSHFSTNAPLPLVPNVVEVGGIHLQPTLPLPQDIQKFMDEARHGVIYFCLGSLLRADTMPDTVRNAFTGAFRQLPQRILWKWEKDVLPGKPNNIMIKKWMPQRDILAHSNIKLFITHGGALGLNEAVIEGVPIIGVPFYGDQTMNLKTIQAAGAGEIISYNELTTENILSKISAVLQNASYQHNANKLSNIYIDRLATPMNTAVFWTEYVIRHDGARHLRSPAINLQWYQYLLLDVITFVLISLLITIYVLKVIVLKILNFAFSRNSKVKSKTRKTQ